MNNTPPPTPPATPTDATPGIAQQAGAVLTLNNAQKAAEASAKALSEMLGGVNTAASATARSVLNLGGTLFDSFKNGTSAIMNTAGAMGGLTKAYAALRASSGVTADLFPSLGKASQGFSTLTEQTKAMGSEWVTLSKLMGGGIAGIGANIVENASMGERAQQNLISIMGTSGQLGKVFDQNGTLIGNLGAQTLKYVENMSQVALANNQTLQSTIAMSQGFHSLPGVMSESVNVGTALGGNINSLSAAMKVMAGSGQSMDQVISAMNTAYKDLGNAQGEVNDKSTKGLTLFSTMSSLSKSLNLQFSETQGFLTQVADKFAMVGNNTEAAGKIMLRFTDSLRNTGLTSTQSLNVIQGMIDGIGKLTVGTKAFISAQNGGPGGLQGSIQIDQLLRQGKSDEVMTMVQDTLRKQFGGKIYTQAEGAQSQEAAAGFTRQKMLLNSGAFGNLTGGDDNKATRLLEALASNDRGKFAPDAVGANALQSVAKQGNSLQEEGNSILNKIAVNSELTQLGVQLMATKTIRDYIGSTGPTSKELSTTRINNESKANDAENRDLSSGTMTRQSLTTNFEKIAEQYGRATSQAFGEATVAGSKMVGDVAKTVMSAGDIIGQIADKTKDTNNHSRIRSQIVPLAGAQLRGALTQGAAPGNQNRATRAATAATATRTVEHRVENTVKIDMTPELRRLITATPTDSQDTPIPGVAGRTLDQMNATGADPGSP